MRSDWLTWPVPILTCGQCGVDIGLTVAFPEPPDHCYHCGALEGWRRLTWEELEAKYPAMMPDDEPKPEPEPAPEPPRRCLSCGEVEPRHKPSCPWAPPL